MNFMRRTGFLGFIVLLLLSWQSISNAQLGPPKPKKVGPPPEFTKAQAGKGRTVYRTHCAGCHGAKLEGLDIAPPLSGPTFDATFRGNSPATLSFHIHRMPPENLDAPVNLSEDDFTNTLAYILQMNNLEPGDKPLSSDSAVLSKFTIPKLPGQDHDPLIPVSMSDEQTALLSSLPSLTDKMLQNPDPKDWLHWGRTYDGQSHSPLKQINKDTVKDLKPSWRAPLLFGPTMPMPVVHNGVMYMAAFPKSVLAMDATNGDVLWRYQHDTKRSYSKKMGLTLHEDKVYVSTSDLTMVALNAKTGALVWESEIKLPSDNPRLRGAIHTRQAPLIAEGVVIQGTIGFRTPGGAFLVGMDKDTGEELWRFNTIAHKGKPGGNTWNDIPNQQRNGGSIWQQGTYDPELGLVYFGVAPTYDTKPLVYATEKPGHTNDAMYTNCTIALDPKTGELVWYYQHMQNDQWDLDWGFERQIATIPTPDGGTVKAVMNVGKMVMLDALDAATGEFLFNVDTGQQNVITAVDPVTGKKTIDPRKMPNKETGSVVCPIPFGARSWPQTSFSPKTNMVYVPITESCMSISETDKGGFLLTSGIQFGGAEDPSLDDGMMGRIAAIDVVTREIAWNTDLTTPQSTGILSTAGGVIFSGDIDPALKAYDDTTGEQLWSFPLDDAPSSSLITYQVGETQYLAVVVGVTNNHIRDITGHYRRWSKTTGTPGFDGGPAIWVFALK